MLSKREKVLIAVLGSLLLHLFILLLFGIGLQFQPPARAIAARDQPIQLEIPPPEDEPPAMPAMPATATPPPPMVHNKENNEPAPDNPAFESNANSQASSDQAATGDAPVPTQEGKQVPEYTFDTHQATLGERPVEEAVNAAQSQPPAQPPQSQATPPPAETPEPTPQDTPPPRPRKDRKTPPTPAPTPEPLIERDEFAMLGPTPTPHPEPKEEDNQFNPSMRQPVTEPPRPTPAVRRPMSPQPPSQQQPPRPANPGYQPMTQKAAMSGSISNKGPSSVAALGTPMGRYHKAVSDAIGSRWYFLVDQHQDVTSFGTVKIHFVIDKSGAVLRPRVISNSGNSTLEGVSLQAITDAEIPPIPPEVAALINSNQMDLDFSFALVAY